MQITLIATGKTNAKWIEEGIENYSKRMGRYGKFKYVETPNLKGKFAKADALWGDSILVIVGVILSSFLNQQSFDFNIFTLIFSVYLVPYIIYMKD